MKFYTLKSNPNYSISESGIIKSLKRKSVLSEKRLTKRFNARGELVVSLGSNSKWNQHRVKDLVAGQFLGFVKHGNRLGIRCKDGNEANCDIGNLEIIKRTYQIKKQ